MSAASVLATIANYAAQVNKVVGAVGTIVEFSRSLSRAELVAQRCRRRAARLYRVAIRADGHGYTRRARNLRARALGRWNQAQRLHPLGLQAAIRTDRLIPV